MKTYENDDLLVLVTEILEAAKNGTWDDYGLKSLSTDYGVSQDAYSFFKVFVQEYKDDVVFHEEGRKEISKLEDDISGLEDEVSCLEKYSDEMDERVHNLKERLHNEDKAFNKYDSPIRKTYEALLGISPLVGGETFDSLGEELKSLYEDAIRR